MIYGDCTWFFSGFQNNPLTIHLTTLNNDKVLNYDYLIDCFSEYEIQKMNSIILHLIDEVLNLKENICDINVLTDEDIEKLEEFNKTGIIEPNYKTVVYIFDEIVEKYENILNTEGKKEIQKI